MTKQIRVQLAAICSVLLLLCIQECLGIKDCTGTDCPVLDNCIEEVLEEGACCATCMRRGCTCEGYQYYDCNKEGFRNGKVPEGRSYFVDSGSTECSCPKGGGKIECHFIPCPEIPANCIALSEPTESCPHCLRIGCIFRDQKYEAGHSFHMDPCQVCHCPKDGGNLMCSPVPNCESELVKEPTEDNRNELHVTKHEVPVGLPTKQHPTFNSNLIPVYTERTSDFDEMDDYDYFLETNSTSSPDSSLQLSSPLSPKTQSPWDGLHLGTRKELKENLGTSDAGSEAGEPMSSPSPMVPTTTAGQSVTSRQYKTPEKPAFQQETVGGVTTQQFQTERPDLSRASTHVRLDEEDAHSSIHHRNGERHDHHHRGKHLDTKVQSTSPEHHPSLKTQSSPTTSPALREREPQRTSQTIAQKEEKDRNDLFTELESQGVPSRMMLNICCEAGEKWASAQGNCINMEPTRLDPVSMCWIVQSQCCRGSLRERKCLDGLRAAREGRSCGADGDDDVCGTDSYKECCSCCALGLSLQRDGGQCEAPQGLGQSCRNVLLTCCLGTDTTNHSVIRERVQPQPTTPPRRVSDRQAMSLDEETDVENAVEKEQEIEGLQDMDECAIYEGQLCQQKCINKPGSYTCTCFSGYTLQPDGSTCLKDAENSLKEHDPSTTFQSLEEKPTTPSSDLLDPCEGKGPCAQLCSPVAGQPLCSCFPGFSLMADGYSCEDINECTLGTHNCGLGFDCINKEGSFRCRATLRCPGGFTLDARGQCGDIDECRTLSQPCSSGFNCVNTIGSYTCQRKILMCGRGYHASPDGTRCIDVDECQTGVHHCGEGQLCHNLPGTYRCDCSVGYQYDMFRRTCVDVNECWRYPGRLCAQTCENTPGSYHCSCTSGFTLSSDGKNCEDVNECQKNPCSQECANVYGSFQCYCKQGYYLREDSLTCDDIDECSQSIGHLCSFKCVNIPGSYHCACPEHGYSMSPNGRSCRDIDECALRAHNCSVEESCYNIQGGFRCLSFHCPPNYRRISDTRCERISCANFVECQSTPVRITYYQLTFQTNIIIPAQIFRIGPSPAYSGDNIIITIVKGNEEGYFSTRKLNSYMGAIYLHRQVQHPRDFFIDVEMKLWRQGTFTTFLARMYIFITANIL